MQTSLAPEKRGPMALGKLLEKYPFPNILIIITDQERALGEWPKAYRATLGKQLKAMTALKRHGLSFEHAYTASCMCSASRATFQTSQYPIVTGCTTTGVSVLPTPDLFPNIASIVAAANANYGCYWIGKWHLFGMDEPGGQAAALTPWGYSVYTTLGGQTLAWDFPDAGINLSDTYLGGGTQGPTPTNQNDQRYVSDAVSFLESMENATDPWCLVVSLVNPHDVHIGFMAPGDQPLDAVYYNSDCWSGGTAPVPDDSIQSPTTMPRGQAFYSWATRASQNANKNDFVNFYAYLTTYVDGQVGTILSAMTDQQKEQTLIIRFSDHGEMGLAHGLIEKFVNAYGQCTHVPLVFSNKLAWPEARTTHQIASLADLAPTLANILGVTEFNGRFVGTNLYDVLLDSPNRGSLQTFVHFTYDDMAGNGGPSIIRTIRSTDWVYSVYLDSVCSASAGYSDADWEMYDLQNDPTEINNLAGQGLAEQTTLDQELQAQMVAKGTAPAWYPAHWPPQATANSRGGPPPGGGTVVPTIAGLPGITAQQVDDLRYVGVRTVAELLKRGAAAEGRKSLASLVPVDEALLDRWLAAVRPTPPG
ncbi:Arylsulfatase A [Rhodospirillales bacterium URHD0017]|nr:Arylsulfatase A [Rhodospirillales bacterium URHD0017]